MEADPEVRRYVGGLPQAHAEAKRRFLAGLSSAEDGLSVKAVVLKSEGAYIGRAGLYLHLAPDGPVPGEASISFYLARPYWGQGLATEAAEAFVCHGLDRLGLRRIVTTIDARNAASRRVLEKLGFRLFATEQGIRQFEVYELRASPQ